MIDYSSLPTHMQGGTRQYIEEGKPGGVFLTKLFSNDVIGAWGRADEKNLKAMPDWMYFIWNQAPTECWGSPEKVSEWARQTQARVAAALREKEEKREQERSDYDKKLSDKANSINRYADDEGWGVYFHSPNVYSIQADDIRDVFETDGEAVLFVKTLARAGSYLHRAALELADLTWYGSD